MLESPPIAIGTKVIIKNLPIADGINGREGLVIMRRPNEHGFMYTVNMGTWNGYYLGWNLQTEVVLSNWHSVLLKCCFMPEAIIDE